MNQVVVITGGSSGIGRSTAQLFAREGWCVGIIGRGQVGLCETARDIAVTGASVATSQADVADSVALSSAADTIIQKLGPIDVWINCAGNGVYGRFDDVPEDDFRRVTDVTYHGTVNGTRVALSLMRTQGRGTIINVCSAAAFYGLPLMSSYSGAKAAVRAFGEAVRGELKLERSQIRLRSVFPPAVNTPFFSHAASYMGWPARPVGPVYQPEVIAQGIWLAVQHGKADTLLSGTAAAFGLVCRISPSLIAWCMGKLKFDCHTTQDRIAHQLLEPTLHTVPEKSLGARGPFNASARAWSVHVWAKTALAATFRVAAFRHRKAEPSIAALPPTPDLQTPLPERADLALRFGDS
jgi:short-subunit dehydrogenase